MEAEYRKREKKKVVEKTEDVGMEGRKETYKDNSWEVGKEKGKKVKKEVENKKTK